MSDNSTQPMLLGLTSFVVGSPASHTQSPVNEKPVEMNGIFGESSRESFAKLNQDGSWLKMSRGYYRLRLDGTSEEFSGTWPRSGSMRNGSCYPLDPLAPPIEETGCLLLPTPTANDAKNSTLPASQAKRDGIAGYLLRTGENPGSEINPAWIEYLMGFPEGWTDLGVSETR